ncbi:phosphoribosylglycinamide formyltransferase [Pelagovum pacificum]|uniref:Phosphoribosylglycinamide formyltransferase n=1 Tax=Pelagovum pacificum TaxID=2588711 RepID=A0A5C5GD56_9RHOB|nr:phosphoribosylglycinamide formyltransferase [Pelagovum pacificum]QQA44270.1 phosphoribosylglycinamide formyltransferase [Pelagovum pacificum]TNY32608.1 phosphoribosylglycinamide formyltransferase [Pelagovum pacificum]
MKRRVAILVSGGGSNMEALLASMEGDHPGEAALVLSNNPDAGGLRRAAARGVPTIAIDHRPFGKDRKAFEDVLHATLEDHRIDIVCLAGFMRVLGSSFVERWRDRMLNIHPSLLPKYTGLHTHERAIAAGDEVHGCSVHVVIPELDAGPVLGQASLSIQSTDTPDSLAARVLVLEHKLYPLVLRRFLDGKTDRVDL